MFFTGIPRGKRLKKWLKERNGASVSTGENWTANDAKKLANEQLPLTLPEDDNSFDQKGIKLEEEKSSWKTGPNM